MQPGGALRVLGLTPCIVALLFPSPAPLDSSKHPQRGGRPHVQVRCTAYLVGEGLGVGLVVGVRMDAPSYIVPPGAHHLSFLFLDLIP